MKNTIRLNEKQLTKLVNIILEDSSENIYTDIDRTYDYKVENNTWYARRKTGGEWIDLSSYPKAVAILNTKTGVNVTPIPNPNPKPEPKPNPNPKPEPKPNPNPKPEPKPKPEDENKLTPQQKLMKAKACGFSSWLEYKSSGFKCGKKPVPKPIEKSDTIVNKTTSPKFLKKIALKDKEISTSKSTPIFSAGQPECAQFVHDFVRIDVNNAWMAHNNDQLGSRIFTVFHGLPSNKVNEITQLWEKIDKSGGAKGNFIDSSKSLVNSLITRTPPKLQLNDVVGLYYPPSDNHEKAFYSGGLNDIEGNRPYIEKKNGKYIPGGAIKSGKGWGMNTHVGIVGAIKNGVPIIFHNIHGQVYADPYNNLLNGIKIVWVRRPGSEPIALNKVKSTIMMSEQITNGGLKKKL